MAKITIPAGETKTIEGNANGYALFTSANTQVAATKVDNPLTFTARATGSSVFEPINGADGNPIPALSSSAPSFRILDTSINALQVTGGATDSTIEVISL